MNLFRLLGVASVAVVLVGCPEIAMKGTIRALVQPKNVAGMKVVSAGNKQFKVTWNDPTDSDVDHIEISLRAPMTADSPPNPVNVALGVQSAIVNVPFNNVQYIVVVKAVDKAGNKSPGSIYTPLSFATAINAAVSLSGNLLLPTTQAPPKIKLSYSAFPLSSATAEADYAYVNGAISTEHDYTMPAHTQNAYHAYTYDFRGNLTRKDDYDPTGAYVQDYYSYQYDSQGNQTVAAYYSGGTSTVSATLSSSDSFQYDASGNQIQDSQYNGSGTLTQTIAYGYDSNRRLVSGTVYDGAGTLQYTFSVQWDSTTGFPSNMTIQTAAGATFLSISWQAGTGVLTANVYVNLFGPYSATVTSSFDSHGLLQQISSVSGTNTQSVVFTHDSDGNTTQEIDNFNTGSTFSAGYTWSY